MKEKIIEAFNTSLGQQCNELYSCSDGKILIRFEEAVKHTEGKLDSNSLPLKDKTIIEWIPIEGTNKTEDVIQFTWTEKDNRWLWK